MSDGKGKWLRFEDGLPGSDVVSDNELTANNGESYDQFCAQCVYQKSAEKRRTILIFLEDNADIKGRRKKDREIDEDENPAKKLLFESIMKSYNIHKVDGRKFLTVLAVRCEDSEIKNEACLNESKIKVKNKKECVKVESARKVLDNGGRIFDDRKRSLWEKYVLIDIEMWETANSQIIKWLSVVLGILFQYWLIIISALYFVTESLREKIVEPYGYVLMIFGVIYCVICRCFKMAKEKAREEVRKEIRYYRNLDYPIIFYNGTGKTKRWMKNYIQKYIEGEKEDKAKESVFYIGAVNTKLEEEKIHKFIIPKGHPEWGLICLCKLVRDLADNPWGEIWSGTVILDKSNGEPVFSPSLETNKEHNISDLQLQIFKMPKDEDNLREQIEKKKNWHFARDPSSEDSTSSLFPIGDSVYAIRKNISWSDFKGEVIKIQRKVMPEIKVFVNSVECQFWLIQIVEKEREVIDQLNEISSRPTWNNDLWEDIWQNIIQLVENLQNEKITKLCEIVWDEKKAKSQMSFADFRNILEKTQREEVNKAKSDQEEFVRQRIRT